MHKSSSAPEVFLVIGVRSKWRVAGSRCCGGRRSCRCSSAKGELPTELGGVLPLPLGPPRLPEGEDASMVDRGIIQVSR